MLEGSAEMTEPSQPITPPRQPGALVARTEVAAWPTVVGIIAIVLGAGGILGGCMAIGSPWFTELMSMNMPSGQVTVLEIVQEWRTLQMISGAVAMVVATGLLIGGIDLVRRRARGVAVCRVFAVVKILFVMGNSVLGYAVVQQQFEVMSGPGMPPGWGGGFRIGAAVGVAFGVLWGWAFPIFLLIWFSRPGVKDTIAGWDS